MKGIFAILGGLGAGAALMYLFDPNEGNRRRAVIRDKAMSINNRAQGAVGAKVQDIGNRAKGLLHEVKSATSSGTEESADTSQEFSGDAQFSGRETFNH